MESAQPHVELFGNRGIEEPFVIIRQEFGIVLGIAVDPAVLVCCLVFRFEVPRVDAHPDVGKPGVALRLLLCETAAIVNYMVRLPSPREGHNLLDKHLRDAVEMRTLGSVILKRHTKTFETASEL
jgi:hypothetical protein